MAKPAAAAPTGPAPQIARMPGAGAPPPEPWAAGGPSRSPLDVYNFASQNMPPWAQRAGVSPVAYAQFLQNHPQSPGAMNMAAGAGGTAPGPAGPNPMTMPPRTNSGRPGMDLGGLDPGGPPPAGGVPLGADPRPTPDSIPPEVLARLRGAGGPPPGPTPFIPNEPPISAPGPTPDPQAGGPQAILPQEQPWRPPAGAGPGGPPQQGRPELQSMNGGGLQSGPPIFRPPGSSSFDKHSMPPPTMRRMVRPRPTP